MEQRRRSWEAKPKLQLLNFCWSPLGAFLLNDANFALGLAWEKIDFWIQKMSSQMYSNPISLISKQSLFVEKIGWWGCREPDVSTHYMMKRRGIKSQNNGDDLVESHLLLHKKIKFVYAREPMNSWATRGTTVRYNSVSSKAKLCFKNCCFYLLYIIVPQVKRLKYCQNICEEEYLKE